MNHPKTRLILCDVDGTLLNKGEAAVSKEVFSAIRIASDNGIRFVLASGRCCADLSVLFAPVIKSVCMVASDGGIAVQNGETLCSAPVQKSIADSLISVAKNAGCAASVLYGRDEPYAIGKQATHPLYRAVSDVRDVCGEIYKIAFPGLSDFAKQKVRHFAKYSGKLKEVYADALWTEFVSAGTDKGSMCKMLQNMWNISPCETAAFGDNTNDFGMLRQAQRTYAASAAVPEIARMCKYRTDNVPNEIIKLAQERGTL